MIPRLIPILGVLALFPIQAALDRNTPTPPNVVETLPPPEVLPVLASGHRETFAAMLEMRAVSFAMDTMLPGEKFTNQDRDHLFLLYLGILTLDQDNVDAAVRGAVLLAAFGWRSDVSVELLRVARGEPYQYKGKTYQQRSANPAHPDFWRLWFEEAGICLSMRANEVQTDELRLAWIRRAGELWIKAEEAGAPLGYGLRLAGENLTRRGLDRRSLLARELELWEPRLASSPAEVRPEIEAHIRAVASLLRAIDLERNPTAAKLIAELKRRGQDLLDVRALGLPFNPDDLEPPAGGTYRIVNGRVVCAEAEAFLLGNSLSRTLKRRREFHPNVEPTLVDLGWVVPPFRRPLSHNAVFRLFGWHPSVRAPKRPPRRGEPKKPVLWWEILPPPPVTVGAFGIKPARYLRYWIEGDRVQVIVQD
ncbi:MAG: hypothetical protein JKY65_30650 [Planctomycetes bacterium]|nr:hypothetical protein [Planctomycetota bacterium]